MQVEFLGLLAVTSSSTSPTMQAGTELPSLSSPSLRLWLCWDVLHATVLTRRGDGRYYVFAVAGPKWEGVAPGRLKRLDVLAWEVRYSRERQTSVLSHLQVGQWEVSTILGVFVRERRTDSRLFLPTYNG